MLSLRFQRKTVATVDNESEVLRMNATCSGRAPSRDASNRRCLFFHRKPSSEMHRAILENIVQLRFSGFNRRRW